MIFGVGNFSAIASNVSQSDIQEAVDRVLDEAIDERIEVVNDATDKKIDKLSQEVDIKLKKKADLGDDGRLIDSQINATVKEFMDSASGAYDDVLEFDSFDSLPPVGEPGVIYIADGVTYYWNTNYSRYDLTSGNLPKYSIIDKEDIIEVLN